MNHFYTTKYYFFYLMFFKKPLKYVFILLKQVSKAKKSKYKNLGKREKT